MIPKPYKDHSEPNNHRSISLLTTLSKVFERILLSHLQKHPKSREEPHAFRQGHSTTTQLVKLTDDLVTNLNNKKPTAAIFLTESKFQIKIGNHTSSIRNIAAGVPQDSCFSPLLYSHYINDTPKEEHVTTTLFADDTIFYSTNPSHNIATIKISQQQIPWTNQTTTQGSPLTDNSRLMHMSIKPSQRPKEREQCSIQF